MTKPLTYTVEVATALVESYQEWTPISEMPADRFRVVLNEDGTAEVWFAKDEKIVYAA